MTRLASSAAAFDKAVKTFSDNVVGLDLPTFHKKLALDALTGIVLNTPVLTGRARGNWQVSINQPIETMVDKEDRGGNSTISAGSVVINNANPFSVIYITNNLPYILFLEEGSSSKAPGGMVAITLERLTVPFETGGLE